MEKFVATIMLLLWRILASISTSCRQMLPVLIKVSGTISSFFTNVSLDKTLKPLSSCKSQFWGVNLFYKIWDQKQTQGKL